MGASSVTARARREQIVAAATAEIADVGLAGASFARIAHRAGVASTRMISYHFTDRDDLVREVVSTVLADASAAIEPHLRPEASPAEQLDGLVVGNIRWSAGHRRDIAALLEIWHAHRGADGRLVFGFDAHELEFAMVGQILEAGQKAGQFRPFDVRTMAVTLRYVLNGMAELLIAEPDVDVEALIEHTVATVRRAVAA